MAWVPKANLRGPVGGYGPQGLPGVNAVANDTATAGYISTAGTSETKTALDARYARQSTLPRNVRDFGAVGDGVANDTVAIQAAIDNAAAAGGGVVFLPDGTYKVAASALGETYDNAGVAVLSSTCGLVLRKSVSLVGTSSARCKITTADKSIIIVAMVAPEGSTVSGLTITAGWVAGDAGAGHGIFVLGTAAGADIACKNVTWKDLTIYGVGSYGIGLQAGSPTGCRILNTTIYDTGADGLDLKARSDVATEPSGNFCTGVTVRNHGQRVTGSAGVDVRGVWHLANVVVTDFGANNNLLSYLGIRFRTKPPVTDAYNRAGARSSLTGFYIRGAATGAPLDRIGIESGSDDVHISNGTVASCFTGVLLSGNAVGAATSNSVHGVTVLDATVYGFKVNVGVVGTVLSSCTTAGSVTAGIRNEGTNTTLLGTQSIGEASPKSTATDSLPSEICQGSRTGNEHGLSVSSAALGRVNVEARGPSADIDIQFGPKGAGVLRFGTYTAGVTSVTGYVVVKDAGGVSRKLAVIS